MHLGLVTSEHSKSLPGVLIFYNREGVLGVLTPYGFIKK